MKDYEKLLIEKKWIDPTDYVYWDLSIVKRGCFSDHEREDVIEQREIIRSRKKFENKLVQIAPRTKGKKRGELDRENDYFHIYQGQKIPILLEEDVFLEGVRIPLLITCSPLIHQETVDNFPHLYSELGGYEAGERSVEHVRNNVKYSNKKLVSSLTELLRKNRYYWNPEWKSMMFLPHVKAIVKEVQEDRIIYYNITPQRNEEAKIAETLDELLLKSRFGKVKTHPNVNEIRYRTSEMLEELLFKGAILTTSHNARRKGTNPKKAKSKTMCYKNLQLVPYDEFVDVNLNEPYVTYVPIKIPAFGRSVPVFLSTRGPYGEHEFIARGIYVSTNKKTTLTKIKKGNAITKINLDDSADDKMETRFYPFVNKNIARAIALQVEKDLGLKVHYAVHESIKPLHKKLNKNKFKTEPKAQPYSKYKVYKPPTNKNE